MGILTASVILLENHLLRHTDGNFCYPLDASFLNVGTAKSFAFHGVWGVSKKDFQPATFSLLFPLTLAVVFFITGAHLVIPIILNTLFAGLLLYALQKEFIRRGIHPVAQVFLLLLIILATALPLLIVSGMEYVLQLLLCFLFMETLTIALWKNSRQLYVYGALAVATRYEDLLLIALACILLILMKRQKQALKLAAAALSPILFFGIISICKGSYFLPTPMTMSAYPLYLITITIAAFLLGVWRIGKYSRAKNNSPKTIRRLSFTLLAVMALPFIVHKGATLWNFQRDNTRIYEQQYTLSRFVHRYFRGRTIGANDLPALAWFTDGRKIDYTGTFSADVARLKKDRSWSPLMADSISRKDEVMFAIVSDPWFNPEHFPRWHKIASWQLPDAQTSPGKLYTFYTVDVWDTEYLKINLRNYELYLPPRVTIHYY